MTELPPDALQADPATLTYEQARDGLAQIVSRLEDGSTSLEESLALWERGEALAKRCSEWLDQAQARLDQAGAANAAADGPEHGATDPAGSR
jgi:exodeoxyribonuclease VII small subunit